jgi:hypothetical protein
MPAIPALERQRQEDQEFKAKPGIYACDPIYSRVKTVV